MFYPNEIYKKIDEILDFDNQEPWDNSGLLLDCGNPTKKILICLDVTERAVIKAVEIGAKVILSHHPLIFNPLKKIDADSVFHTLIKNDISVICAHTNFDKYEEGTSFAVAKKLGLKFIPSDGIGISASLSEATTVRELAGKCNDIFGRAGYTLGDKQVKKIYICPGSGSGENEAVVLSGADCYLTGECKYHDMLDLAAMGISVITVGHDRIEKISLEYLDKAVKTVLPQLETEIYTRENLQKFIQE